MFVIVDNPTGQYYYVNIIMPHYVYNNIIIMYLIDLVLVIKNRTLKVRQNWCV